MDMTGNRTASVINHGCKLNQYEGESIEYSLEKTGFRIVDFRDDVSPDVVVVNTCTVTNRSDRKSRNTILRAARALADRGLLVVTGCYAQTNPDELKELQGVVLVVGTREKPSIPSIVASHFRNSTDMHERSKGPFDYPVPDTPHRSRVFMKVQDGCDMHCAYCKVPLARGRSTSSEPEGIIRALNRVHERGYREVVLTGVNIGSYDWHGRGLSDLLTLILQETPDTLRIRLSSIEPESFNESLLRVITHCRIMPHFHVPLQSGSDRILKRMNRSYGITEYLSIIERIRRVKPHSHVATDLIVGFPGENEEDFSQTLRAVESAQFASLHIFRFSPRDGTAAALLRDELPPIQKTERCRELSGLGMQLNHCFRKQFEGTVRDAVLERQSRGFCGITDNYIRVMVREPNVDLTRSLLPVKILHTGVDETTGTVIGP
jgi:threonylcarbamoyladenosine tRNA methylthiotransferase MtaB